MSREAIESFVEEIREQLPRLRRTFALVHADPSDHESLCEAHRLAHSIKGTAALVGVEMLSQIADALELLLEQLIECRLVMDDLLRDTLERVGDVIESYVNGLQAGNVPEQRLLSEALELCNRHRPLAATLVDFKMPDEPVSVTPPLPDLPDTSTAQLAHNSLAVPAATRSPDLAIPTVAEPLSRPSRATDQPLAPSEPPSQETQRERFHREALEHLLVMVDMLDTYRRDLTRWDVLADVRRRVHSLQLAARQAGQFDFAELAHHAEVMLQRVLDRTVPPSEQAADCLQACVDALEQRLDGTLDASLLQLIHERIDELCVAPPSTSPASESLTAEARNTANTPNEIASADESSCKHEDPAATSDAAPSSAEDQGAFSLPRPASGPSQVIVPRATLPAAIELDDRSLLSDEMLEVFTEEADDHLRVIYAALAELEKSPEQMSRIQTIRRAAHTIKGAAGSVGLRLISRLAHRLEDLLDKLFAAQQPITASTLALLYDSTDALQDLVHGNDSPNGMQVTVAQLYNSFDAVLGRDVPLVVTVAQADDERDEPAPAADSQQTATFCDDAPLAATTSDLVSSDNEPQERSITAESPAAALSDAVAESVTAASNEVPPAPATHETIRPNELVVQDFLPLLAPWNRLAEPVTALPSDGTEPPTRQTDPKRAGESLRVPLARIDSLVREVGELIINRSAFEQRMSDFARNLEELQRAVSRLRSVSRDLDAKYGVGALGGRRTIWSDGDSLLPGGIRFAGQVHDEFDALEMDRYTEFHLLSRSLAETASDIGTVSHELRNLRTEFDQLLSRQERLSRDTQDRLMRIRMMPLATLAPKLHRTVRVIAGQQHKDIELLIQGSETELDKLVLEELADPLMHLLRNAVDHGIEPPATRAAAGKPERATIRVQAFTQGTQVVIRVSDDGAGLDFEAIRRTAVRHGLVSAEEAATLGSHELSTLIFLPGFSTAREISEISGRGVGMDIVRDKVQKLHGTINIESQPGQGTTFTIRLPMTLAVMRALMVHCGQNVFAIPLASVVQVLRLEQRELTLLGPGAAIRLGDESLPYEPLAARLGLRTGAEPASPTVPVIVLADGEHKTAFGVDKVLPGRDIVVKSLGTHLRKVHGLIGATLLGDGSIVPILNAADLVHPTAPPRSARPLSPAASIAVAVPTIMVVDDSVSVRRVMSNLLKSAGWRVLEAKDGLDALDKLLHAEQPPNLFLLDIEMPRMDGYELLTSLRSREEHRQTPIVMVTSRASDKHRRKALRLGASDYVIKPYQDEPLLALLRRLLAEQPSETLV